MGTLRAHVRGNLIGYLALFVALGGTGYAAGQKLLPRNSVGSAQVINRSLLSKDFKKGQLPRGAKGDRGSTGAKGATGAVGPATGPASGDLQGSYPGPTIKNGAVTPAKLAPAEAWHEVGAPGEPGFAGDFGPDCIGGTAHWTNYDSNHNSAAFYKDAYGAVHLKGLVKLPNAECAPGYPSVFGQVFYLPAGFRPAKIEQQATISSGSVGGVEIGTDGKVKPIVGSVVSFSLDDVTFRSG
jgi:hypothetical protein